ncbi:MAG: MASE1 domain-containing protein [Planctomycetes bacterium]|nr:MASE1 domain-containing protein [Planctomycetota bacterium]
MRPLLVAGGYFVAARLSLLVAFEGSNASPVWPPSGLALAATLLWGRGVVPGVWLGAFLANATAFLAAEAAGPGRVLVVSAVVGVGNALEADVAARLVGAWTGGHDPLRHPGDVGRFLLAVTAACAVSASVGPTAITAAGLASWGLYGTVWFTWWLGALAGILVVAPAALALPALRRLEWTAPRRVEAVAWAVVVLVVAWAIFGERPSAVGSPRPIAYLLFPLVVALAFRLDRCGVALAVVATSAAAVCGTVQGLGPFYRGDLNTSLLLVQTFLASTSATSLLVASARVENGTLRESERRKDVILCSALDAVVTIDGEGRIVEFTPSAERLFGYAREEVLGQTMAETLIPAGLRAAHRAGIAHYLDTGQGRILGRRVRMPALRRGGEEFLAEVCVTTGEDSRGHPLFIGFVRDLSEAGRLEAEIEARNHDLETMLHVISHDLKEPLRGIEAFSVMLTERHAARLDADGVDLLGRIRRAAARMRQLLDDLLTIARARSFQVPRSEVDAAAVVTDVLARLEQQIRELGAEVQVAEKLPRIRADRTWATEAVYNLVTNALKFGSNGSRPTQVSIGPYVRAPGEPEGVGLVVADRGPGVAEGQSERIFELFRRATGREVEGTGVGLSIVRAVAERHGGRAWVRPREGGGSEFVMTFGRPPTRLDPS